MSFAAHPCTWRRVAKTAGREGTASLRRSAAAEIWTAAAGPAADHSRGGVANTGRHPVERISLRGDREAGLRRMQRCSPALMPRALMRLPPARRLGLGGCAKPAFAVGAHSVLVTVFHDDAVVVSPAGFLINAIAFPVHVAFDRTSRVRRWRLDAHRFGGCIDFSETRFKLLSSYRITQNDQIVVLLFQSAWTEIRRPGAKQSAIDRVSLEMH